MRTEQEILEDVRKIDQCVVSRKARLISLAGELVALHSLKEWDKYAPKRTGTCPECGQSQVLCVCKEPEII